ncbi:hypothetical protein P9112_012125 [Eukaryota sp. TZLM1-RC]
MNASYLNRDSLKKSPSSTALEPHALLTSEKALQRSQSLRTLQPNNPPDYNHNLYPKVSPPDVPPKVPGDESKIPGHDSPLNRSRSLSSLFVHGNVKKKPNFLSCLTGIADSQVMDDDDDGIDTNHPFSEL